MTKQKKILITTISVVLCILLSAVLLIVLKKRVFPALNDYKWSYEQEFTDEHDSDMVIDGKLDESVWTGQKWLTHSENGVTLKYTTVFTKYGVYVGAVADDDDLQWTKRFNFGMYNNNASNSAFHFRISHSDAEAETTFTTFNFYIDAKDSVSRNQTRHEAKSSLNGELNPKDGQTKATQMTSEMFISWDALHLKDGKPESIRIYPEYRYVEGEKSLNNKWIAPICYVRINTAMLSCALFDESGYVNADETGAILGNSKTEMSKSDGWDISKADKGSVTSSDYYEQNIFYRDVCSDAYIYSTTMKITGQQKGKTGYAGVCDIKDSQNATMFYVNAAGVLSDAETLTIYMRDYAAEKTTTIGTIPNKASYKTKGIPLTVIKDNKNLYYIVDGNLVYAKEVSIIEGQSSPGFFTSSAAVEYTNCKVTDYADNKDELKEILSKYAILVEKEGSISGGSVTTDTIAIARNGKVAGEDLELSIIADNGYILTELTIEGTNQKSSDYLAYAVKNMLYGSLVIPKETITGDVVISAKFTSVMKVFDKDSLITVSGKVLNATGEMQSAKIVIHHKGSINPILSSITQSSVSGEFDIYLLKKGTYTIGNGVTIKSDGQFTLGASNNGYLTTYASADTNNSEQPIEIVLKKNRVSRGYSETGEGYYKSSSADAHNYFTGGITDEWNTNMTLPEMPEGQQVGYVLHEASSSVTWTQWIRIAAVAKEGKLNVFVYMNVDGAVFAQKYYNTGIDAAQAEGKVLQLMLKDGKLACHLDNKLVFLYVDNSMLNDYTVSEVIGLNDKVACGLYTNKAGVVLKDYMFTREVQSEGEALYQVSGTVTADTDAMRRFQMIVTNIKTGELYITDVDQYGKYSIALPVGQYRFILKHYSQDKFFYPTPLENNVIRVSQNMDNVAFTAKPVTTAIGTFNCELNIPLVDAKPDEFKLRLTNDTYGEYNVYRNQDGSFTTNAPVGTYRLSVKHKTESLYVENLFTVKIKEGQNNKTVTLKKNAITNGSFALTEELYYQSTDGYRHNRFTKSHGAAWETWLEMPALNEEEQVGFIIHRYQDDATVWGNWLRLMVGKNDKGKIEVVAQICADATRNQAEINVSTSRPTDINADDVVGKKLQVVYKNGILSLRLDGQIINLYTNDTYLASRNKSTQVKNVLDLNGELTCGLLTNKKGIVIKDWAFTNVTKNVPSNPVLNGTLKGKVELSIDTLKLDQVRILLKSKDGQMSFHTYAKADGTYEIKAPAGEYLLEVSNDGVATYTNNTYEVTIRKIGTTQNVVLDSKNAVNNSSFTLNENGYYESTKAYGHNTFGYGHGKVWEASLELPELNGEEQVGFVIHRYQDNATVWGNWLRLLVGKNTDGKIELAAQICADATKDTAEINVSTSRPTDIDADDVVGKKLQVVYNDGVLSVRLDGQIINLYTNETYLASRGKSTQVKKVLDLNGELSCGLLTNTKGIVIKDWAFTNIEKNVPENPVLNGTLKGKVKLSIDTLKLNQVRILLKSKDGKTSFHTYAKADGTYEIKAPVGKYLLEVSNDGVATYTNNTYEVTISKDGTTKNIVLDSKNAINNNSFTLNENGYYESTKAYGHNTFGYGHGKVWEASIELPELNGEEQVGFVIHRYQDNATVWSNWLRLLVGKNSDGKIELAAQICADATKDTAEINVSTSRPTDIAADDVVGKKLQVVYNDGVLSVRLDGQIINLYTNETYLASRGKSTQVKNVLDLNGELSCGLLTNTKGIVIKDWAFTNIEKNVPNNPVLNGTLEGKIELSIDTLKLDQVRILLKSKDGKTSFHTYAKADGTYEIKAPVGEHLLEVSNDGVAAYTNNTYEVAISKDGTTKNIVLDSKNAINNNSFTLNENGYYESTKAYGHNTFGYGHGDAWEASLELPELNRHELVGFVILAYENNATAWGKWLRLGVVKTAEDKLQILAQMNADPTENSEKIDVTSDIPTDLNADDYIGKKLQAVYKDGMLTLRLDGEILTVFTNDTYLTSSGNSAQVGDVLDLNGELSCGLLTSAKGITIKDWAFTNKEENVSSDTTLFGTVSGTVTISIDTMDIEKLRLTLHSKDGIMSFQTYAKADGTYELQAPVGEYMLEVTNDGKAAYVPYQEDVTITEAGTTKNIVLDSKNAINNGEFTLNQDGHFESANAYGHNTFRYGYGDAWEASLELPELNRHELVGFVILAYENNATAWGKWLRLGVVKTEEDKLQISAQIHADAIEGSEEIAVTSDIPTDLNADDYIGKKLQAVYKNGMLTLHLDGEILTVFTNDTYLTSAGNSVQVGDVLDLNGELSCGLLASAKGITIKDWAFTNKEENVSSDATLFGTVSGTVTISIDTMDIEKLRLTLRSKDGIMSFQTYAKADGTYELQAPVGEYILEVTNDGKAAYVPYQEDVTITEAGTTKNIVLDSKNAINNGEFTLNQDGHFESANAYGHNTFRYGYGDAWEASLEMPELNRHELVGFVIHAYENNATAWGKWLRLGVVKTAEGKLQITAQIHANAVNGSEIIDVTKDIPTNLNADDYIGKELQAVYKDGILTLRLDGDILTVFTNDTYLKASSNSTKVSDVLDLNGELSCGLLASAKGITIKDWAFTNIKENVSNNPSLFEASGTVSVGVQAADVSTTTLTFVNKADGMIYKTKPNAQGEYAVMMPSGDYEVTISGSAHYEANTFECSVTGDVTKDFALRKNIIYKNSENNYFQLTSEGYYKALEKDHTLFQSASGAQWVADMELPNLALNEEVGFVLVKKNGNSIGTGNWMRILVKKADDGKLKLFTQMHVDNSFDEATAIDLTTTSTEGKVLQVALMNKKIFVSLDDEILAEYDSSTAMKAGSTNTVETTFGKLGNALIYCGLYVQKDQIIKDWNFSNVIDMTQTYTVSGKITSGLAVAKVSDATVKLVDKTNASNTYSVKVESNGNYSITVPIGYYEMRVSHSTHYLDNIFDCMVFGDVTKDISLRKNAIFKNAEKWHYEVTEDVYLKSLQESDNPLFHQGSGTQWVADMELPNLDNNQKVGFVLIKKEGGVNWKNWMHILVQKADDGTLKLFTQLTVGDANEGSKAITLQTTSTEGKVLQVAFMNQKIFVSLDDEIIAEYDSNTTMKAGGKTVGATFGTSGTLNDAAIYCGPFASTNLVIKDWNFSDVIDMTQTYTVSGKITSGLAVAKVSDATVKLVDKTNAGNTHSVKPDSNGNYSVTVPIGYYEMTVSHPTHYLDNIFDCMVFGDVTKDISLRKNAIFKNAENRHYEVTEDVYLKSLQESGNPLFHQGSGTQWVADMELPNLDNNQKAGFVLIKKDGGVNWDNWMRILVQKADDGTLKLFTELTVAKDNEGTKAIPLPTTSTEGKVLQVAFMNQKIFVSLDDEIIAEYDSSTTMEAGYKTVGAAFGTSGTLSDAAIYCGPFASTNLVIKDWNFSDVSETWKTYTVSGTVSSRLAAANVSNASITFVNKADTSKVYTTKPNTEGNYSIQLPTGGYNVTVSYGAYYVNHILECNVTFGNVTQNISLTKNKVSNEGTSFKVTEDGNYQSIPKDNYSHNRFNEGYGSAWVASLELPDMTDGQGVGFVLHQRENNKIEWGKWMRILVKKTSGEAIELYTQMHVDNSFDEATTVYVPETYAAGKTLQVALINNNIIVTLDGTVIATYDSSTKLENSYAHTVGEVFGDLSNVYCGLLANDKGIVIKDWNFSNVLEASKAYTVSGTVSSVLADADVSQATLTFVNKADTSKVYTTKPNAQGKYSVQVPSGEYKVTVSYSARYVDNIFNITVVYSDVTQDFSLRKNKVSDESNQFKVTTEGYYQSKKEPYTHNTFQMGYGSSWVASLELPDVQADQGVGFVLCKREGSVKYSKWMRILVKKANDGTIDLYTQTHLDADVNGGTTYDEATTVSVSETYAAGKTLQVSLASGKITVTLDGVVIAQYDKNTKLAASHTKTVEYVLGNLSVINCGLLANKSGIVIKDWNFNNVSTAGANEALKTAIGGKALSVLGDSISTWGGVSNNTAYNATIGTNNPYYNGSNMTALTAMNQTYWGSVMEKYNMSLCVNNSFSSGRLVDDWTAASNGVNIPSALKRCTELDNKHGMKPDVIAIYIGTNDFKTAKAAGVYTTADEFGAKYQEMLNSIKTKYSGAKVFCFTLIPNNQREDQAEWNAFNDKIRAVVANNSSAILVDIANDSGINWSNYTDYTVDGVHPNLAGMKKITEVFETALYDTYVQ